MQNGNDSMVATTSLAPSRSSAWMRLARPVAEPEPAVVPTRRFAELDAGHEDAGRGHRPPPALGARRSRSSFSTHQRGAPERPLLLQLLGSGEPGVLGGDRRLRRRLRGDRDQQAGPAVLDVESGRLGLGDAALDQLEIREPAGAPARVDDGPEDLAGRRGDGLRCRRDEPVGPAPLADGTHPTRALEARRHGLGIPAEDGRFPAARPPAGRSRCGGAARRPTSRGARTTPPSPCPSAPGSGHRSRPAPAPRPGRVWSRAPARSWARAAA